MKQNNNNGKQKEDEEENKDDKRDYMTLKEIFDAFEHFCFGKYSTNTILKYNYI